MSMYTLNPEKYQTALPTPYGTFRLGQRAEFIKVPKHILQQWLDTSNNRVPDFIQTGDAPDLYEDMDEDILDGLDRTTLKQTIVLNKLQVLVKQKWSDDEVRQAIREAVRISADLNSVDDLRLPSQKPEEKPEASA